MDLVVLAAGKGTRMNSEIPKVLHRPSERKPMIEIILDTLSTLNFENTIVITGYKEEMVRNRLKDYPVNFVTQKEQLGTAHAVETAKDEISSSSFVVLNGDLPLIKSETITRFKNEFEKRNSSIAVLTTEVKDPAGYGRVLRNETGEMTEIVEEKDLNEEDKEIKEINTGIYAFSNEETLWGKISEIDSGNRQNEFYLTDLVDKYATSGKQVAGIKLGNPRQFHGVNTRSHLAEAGDILNRRKINRLLERGVSIVDPDNTYIHDQVRIGRDTIIRPATHLYGETVIEKNCVIGPNTRIENSRIKENSTVENSVLKNTNVNRDSSIGPFSVLENLKPRTEN